MTKKMSTFTAAALGAAGAGAALALTRKYQQSRQAAARPSSGYRNTERGKQHPQQQGDLLFQRQLRGLCPAREARRRR